jgi:hypothetical protein
MQRFACKKKGGSELTRPDLQYQAAINSNKSVRKLIPKNTQKNVVSAKRCGFYIGYNNKWHENQ